MITLSAVLSEHKQTLLERLAAAVADLEKAHQDHAEAFGKLGAKHEVELQCRNGEIETHPRESVQDVVRRRQPLTSLNHRALIRPIGPTPRVTRSACDTISGRAALRFSVNHSRARGVRGRRPATLPPGPHVQKGRKEGSRQDSPEEVRRSRQGSIFTCRWDLMESRSRKRGLGYPDPG